MKKEKKGVKGEKVLNFIEKNYGAIAGGVCCIVGFAIGRKYTQFEIAYALAKVCEYTPELEPLLYEATKKAEKIMRG